MSLHNKTLEVSTICRLYGKFVASYESGSLRRFQEGRTDNIRGNTREAAAYCRSMTDPSKSVEERGRLLRQAVKAHRAYTNDVSTIQLPLEIR